MRTQVSCLQVQSSFCGIKLLPLPHIAPSPQILLTHPTSPRLVKLVFGGRRALSWSLRLSWCCFSICQDSAVTSLDILLLPSDDLQSIFYIHVCDNLAEAEIWPCCTLTWKPSVVILPLIGPTPNPSPVLPGPSGSILHFWPLPDSFLGLPVCERLNFLWFPRCFKLSLS